MSSFSWGSTSLNVLRDSYSPPLAEAVITETPLLPDPADLSAVSTVLQQGGSKRAKVSLTVICFEYAEYQAMQQDWLNGTERTFTGADGYNATMIIMALGQATRKLYRTRFEFSVTFMEV